MKTPRAPQAASQVAFPDADALAALRAWYAGLPARQVVERYLGAGQTGQSSRALLGDIRRQLAAFAIRRHRADLASLFEHSAAERTVRAKAIAKAIETLRTLPTPTPALIDDVTLWTGSRTAKALHAAGLRTLGDVAVRVLHRQRWWAQVPGLGAAGARQLRAVLEQTPELLPRAQALTTRPSSEVTPLERLTIPLELDGSAGAFRGPPQTCTLAARTDAEAIQAWLRNHETTATARAYRKEAERLLLWSLTERRKPLSSLTTDDAMAYRTFLRHPTPRSRWVGPARPRSSPEWRPFQGDLSTRSVVYSLSVIGAMFRWLVEQRYLLANPFAGLKVKGARHAGAPKTSRALTGHELTLVRQIADLLDLTLGWSTSSAQRMRFILDFWFATGLRPSELVGARLGNIEREEGGDSWLYVVGKGDKAARVALPLLATSALERYLVQRGLPASRQHWNPAVPLVPSLEEDSGGVTTSRLWAMMKRFFGQAAEQLRGFSPALAEKLTRATPHWMRHTHATYALAAGADLTTVRDNLRHASISTTSVYLNADDTKRARQLGNLFPLHGMPG